MRYRKLGRTGLLVSEVGLGTMMFGEKTGEAEATRIIHRAIEAGVNLIDVADVYAGGESERIVGRALQGRRHRVVLATKVGRATALGEGLSRRYLFQAVEPSLRRRVSAAFSFSLDERTAHRKSSGGGFPPPSQNRACGPTHTAPPIAAVFSGPVCAD